MKKIIVICMLSSIASADMCLNYWDGLLKENDKLQKAIKYNLKSEYKNIYKWLLHDAKKVVIECEEGDSKQTSALKIIDSINKMNGLK